MSAFFNSDHELRSGWKFLLFLVAIIVAFVALGLTASLLIPPEFLLQNEVAALAINSGLSLVCAVAATLFMTTIVERKPISTFGISLHKGWARDFLVGIIIAAAMLVITVIASMALGTIDIQRGSGATAAAILTTAALLIQAAAFEEVVFRGYPMQVLMRGIGVWPAALLMSALFGLVHANNPNASAVGIINTVLAGILLSAAFLKTRSLWFPYGIHLAWNAGIGMVLGFSLSGLNIASLWTTTVTGPDLLVGGGYGPEGGIVGTIAFAAGIALLKFWKTRNHSQETQ
jgi:uncharacterized protein